MFSWKDLLIVGLELLAIATLVKSTFAQSRSPIVMFCGPSQASTLLSKAMLKGLSLRAPKFLKKSCPPEFFNPSCSLKVRNSKTLAFCFGSNGFHDNMWKVCTSERFEDVLNLARENGFMFAKENFGNGFQLQYLNQNNFTTFIAFRSAKHTFPTPGSKWYLDIWKSLMRTSRKDLLQLPSGTAVLFWRFTQTAKPILGLKKVSDVCALEIDSSPASMTRRGYHSSLCACPPGSPHRRDY
ncbi:unnamed protein product [Bathycoccus prasinos]